MIFIEGSVGRCYSLFVSADMPAVPLGVSSPPIPFNLQNPIHSRNFSVPRRFLRNGEELARHSLNPSRGGIGRTSQAVELFPAVCPEVVVREARIDDCWEVAETHCSSFFPNYSFPLDLALRIDRLVALISGFSKPIGCMRTCLVAVIGSSAIDNNVFGSADLFNRGSVAGILTVDTVADFLPRKGPLRQRRTGIAYISNVAVRQKDRRKGIAKKLIAKAEAFARSWGCRAIALHCDANNPAATALYMGHGFRCIKVPANANWPQPKTSPGVQFNFMMKLISTKPTT